ncbi:MAG: hypothetical protein A2731_03730 [Candidatus Buchananbacteria bacterium RIFCSPHIGHO2_01_FULL_39_8]|uniref:Histidine kinase N-terminal 7TM region domain-containing protein n=1 Tax=Candidatus Buchananbacteria bacterium RIFCSPHIGHO2_01_FULL_39_8 TaxID=1797533 RepID=A0A1G1XUP0_9BACT|nr:MAG: hypothetical protein A2731_03730 [Candidatus Buchananbacteria bacterium RIFCSPHIGHO2_01_FULL_39_8]
MDFLKIVFSILLYLNVPMAIASFIFAFILLRRAKGNPIYFNFGMAVLFMALWMLVTLLDFFRFTLFTSTFHALLSFAVSIWVLHFFLLFTYNFPAPKLINEFKILFFYLATFVISLSAFLPGLYVTSGSVEFPFRYREINPLGLSIFTIYFTILAIIAFFNLFQSYERSDGLHKTQLKKIMAGTAIAIVANLIVSLINYYYTSFDLTSVGIFSTFTVLVYIYSILFSKKVV